jgi:hypothetical protein
LRYSIVVARIFLVPIALLGLYLAARVVIYALVITRGEQITGTVERTGVNKSQRYVVYSYEAGGRSHSGSRDITAQGYRLLAPGQRVPLRVMAVIGRYYDAAIIPGESKWAPVYEALIPAFLFNLLATFGVSYFAWIHYWLEKRLCRWGTPVVGRITDKRERHDRSWVAHELYYQFDHPTRGTSTSQVDVAHSQWKQARVGDTVTILCYPHRRASRSLIYEHGYYICVE